MDDEARREVLGATGQVTRAIDFICLGRAAVDLYGQQRGARLEDMQSFAKYLGGSSGERRRRHSRGSGSRSPC